MIYDMEHLRFMLAYCVLFCCLNVFSIILKMLYVWEKAIAAFSVKCGKSQEQAMAGSWISVSSLFSIKTWRSPFLYTHFWKILSLKMNF